MPTLVSKGPALQSSPDPTPIRIRIGGRADEFRDFPSTRSRKARDLFDTTGEETEFATIGHVIIGFIEQHCVLTDAAYAGEAFMLMPWQKRLLMEMYETAPVDGRDLLRYRWALIGMPKKGGKTELAAALGLAHCVALSEVSPNVICAASSEDQANLVFSAASRMVEWSPTLKPFFNRTAKELVVNTAAVPGSLKRVAAAAGTNDGKNVSACIIDELHEWVAPKSRNVFTTLTQGGGARDQPINIMITTAGSDEDTVCFELYQHGINVRDGDVIDDTFYFIWYEAPAGCDHTDPKMWEAANPSWGLILKEPFYRDLVTKRRESEFRRYFLNQWTEAEVIWEAAQHWDGCAGTPILEEDVETYIGIDVAYKHDACAVVVCQVHEGLVHAESKIWSNPYPFMDSRHDQWSLPLAEVENFLLDMFGKFPESTAADEEEYPLPGPAFYYDPHLFKRSAELLIGEGLNMVEFPQTASRMVPASQALFEYIKTRRLIHIGDPIMRKHIRSVVAKETERGWRITKPSGSKKHVDGAVALAMATYMATTMNEEQDNTVNIW